MIKDTSAPPLETMPARWSLQNNFSRQFILLCWCALCSRYGHSETILRVLVFLFSCPKNSLCFASSQNHSLGSSGREKHTNVVRFTHGFQCVMLKYIRCAHLSKIKHANMLALNRNQIWSFKCVIILCMLKLRNVYMNTQSSTA